MQSAALWPMAGIAFAAKKGKTLPEHWWCIKQMVTVPGADGYDSLVDDGGDVMLPIHTGKEFAEACSEDGSWFDLARTDNAEF